jgi:hypothetical protein
MERFFSSQKTERIGAQDLAAPSLHFVASAHECAQRHQRGRPLKIHEGMP